MSDFLNHPEFYNQPVCLTDDEINYPIKVIERFFTDYSLSDIRTIHDEIEEVCLTTDSPLFANGSQRSDFLFYLNNLIRLLEAAFVLPELKSQRKNIPKS
jgi:hypothetical protein